MRRLAWIPYSRGSPGQLPSVHMVNTALDLVQDRQRHLTKAVCSRNDIAIYYSDIKQVTFFVHDLSPDISHDDNTTDAISGVGTANPSRAHECVRACVCVCCLRGGVVFWRRMELVLLNVKFSM